MSHVGSSSFNQFTETITREIFARKAHWGQPNAAKGGAERLMCWRTWVDYIFVYCAKALAHLIQWLSSNQTSENLYSFRVMLEKKRDWKITLQWMDLDDSLFLIIQLEIFRIQSKKISSRIREWQFPFPNHAETFFWNYVPLHVAHFAGIVFNDMLLFIKLS